MLCASLPSEILLLIFSFLQDDQLFSRTNCIQLVCKDWNTLLQHSKFFWLERFHSHVENNSNDLSICPAPIHFISQYFASCPFHLQKSNEHKNITPSSCDICFVSLFRKMMYQWKIQSSIFISSLFAEFMQQQQHSLSLIQFSKQQFGWNMFPFQHSLVQWKCKVKELIVQPEEPHSIQGILCFIPISELREQQLWIKVLFSKPISKHSISFSNQIPELMLQCRTFETIKASNPFQPVQQEFSLSHGPLIIPDVISVEGIVEWNPFLLEEQCNNTIDLFTTTVFTLYAISWNHVEEQELEPCTVANTNLSISSFVNKNWIKRQEQEEQEEENRVSEFQYAIGTLFTLQGQVKKVYEMTRCFKIVPQIDSVKPVMNWFQRFTSAVFPELNSVSNSVNDLTIIYPPKSIPIKRPITVSSLEMDKLYPTLIKEQDEVMIMGRLLYPKCLLAYEVVLKKPSYLCILRYILKSLFAGSGAYVIHFKILRYIAKDGALKFSLKKYGNLLQQLKNKKLNFLILFFVVMILVGVESIRMVTASSALFSMYLFAGLSAIHFVQALKLFVTLLRQIL